MAPTTESNDDNKRNRAAQRHEIKSAICMETTGDTNTPTSSSSSFLFHFRPSLRFEQSLCCCYCCCCCCCCCLLATRRPGRVPITRLGGRLFAHRRVGLTAILDFFFNFFFFGNTIFQLIRVMMDFITGRTPSTTFPSLNTRAAQ